jgi:hypothetical protein
MTQTEFSPPDEALMDRAQHLAWAKARALEYVERGELANAIASLVSDLGKHEALRDADMREGVAISAAANGNGAAVRRWIEGFN